MTTIEIWKTQSQLEDLEKKLKSKNFEAQGIKVIHPFGWVEEWFNYDNEETVLLQRA